MHHTGTPVHPAHGGSGPWPHKASPHGWGLTSYHRHAYARWEQADIDRYIAQHKGGRAGRTTRGKSAKELVA